MARNNIVQIVGNQTVQTDWKPADSNQNIVAMNTDTSHLMRFKYDEHDVTVAFSNTSPDLGELRVGQSFTFTGTNDSLEISLLKTAVRDGKVKELDFSLRLGKGGMELVFVIVEDTHLTIKGHRFAGESSSHILFKALLFPFLQRKVVEVKSFKKEVKVEVKHLEIIDLTNEEEEDVPKTMKREWYEVATIEEMDHKRVKIEDKDLPSVKGKTGPPPSTMIQLLQPSKTLAILLPNGEAPATRSEIMKGLWVYIKKQKLQDPNEKHFFTPDQAMQTIFGSDRIRGCSMAKYLKNHLTAV